MGWRGQSPTSTPAHLWALTMFSTRWQRRPCGWTSSLQTDFPSVAFFLSLCWGKVCSPGIPHSSHMRDLGGTCVPCGLWMWEPAAFDTARRGFLCSCCHLAPMGHLGGFKSFLHWSYSMCINFKRNVHKSIEYMSNPFTSCALLA